VQHAHAADSHGSWDTRVAGGGARVSGGNKTLPVCLCRGGGRLCGTMPQAQQSTDAAGARRLAGPGCGRAGAARGAAGLARVCCSGAVLGAAVRGHARQALTNATHGNFSSWLLVR